MRKIVVMVIFALVAYSSLCHNLQATSSDIQSKIDYIYKYLQKEQAKTDISQRFVPLPRWKEDKGVYRSYIHVNWISKSSNSYIDSLLRNNVAVIDSNNFVTSFVLMNLLETYEITGKKIDEDSFMDGLKVLLDYKDKNFGNNTPIYTFWKQKYDDVSQVWSQYPDNISKVVETLPFFSETLINWLTYFKMEGLANFLKSYNGLRNGFLYAYRIPADLDDTSVNLAITGRLSKLSNHFPKLSSFWSEQNNNFTHLFSTIKKFAYRPFLNYSATNTTGISDYADVIDTRSYFVIHGYLSEKRKEAEESNTTPNVILPTTWIFDIELQKKLFPYISMPFSVNNVDHNVAINFLFGMTNFLLFHKNVTEIETVFDQDVQLMFNNTVELVIYAIKNDVVNKRPDLTLIYYPSVYDFYWLVTRVYECIDSNVDNANNKFVDYLREIRNKLQNSLLNEATQQILSRSKIESEDNIYFEEFLGNYANYTRGEDRLFSTGLALNSLMNIYTIRNNTSNKYYFIQNTTQVVKDAIRRSANFIMKKIDNYFISSENAFFSGSVKSKDSIPHFYPSNYFVYLNGTAIPDISDGKYANGEIICGTKVMTDNEYTENLNKTFFSRKPPTEFIGFNEMPFPYWSSPAMTYSVNLVALSKYKQLE